MLQEQLPTPSGAPKGHQTILVVEGGHSLPFCALLASPCREIEQAESAKAALDSLARRVPTMVILDMQMAGLEPILQQLLSDTPQPACLFFALPNKISAVPEVDVSDVLPHPPDPALLEFKVRTLLRLRAQRLKQLQLEEELLQTRQQAEAATLARTRFLESVSHELRTPLNAILGFSEILLSDQPCDDQTRRRFHEVIYRSGSHLLNLVDRLLLLSTSGGEPAATCHFVHFDFDQMVRESLVAASESARHAAITLTWQHPDVGYVVADREKIRQVVDNLISNAIKFTRPQGRVHVWLSRTDTTVTVSVEDSGIGIAPEDRPKLFQLFARGRSARKSNGTGIGLALCRDIVERHGGQIGVEPVQHEGSRFWFRIPCRQGGTQEPLPPFQAAVSSAPRRILVVEDDEFNQMYVDTVLSNSGFQSDLAPDGSSALRLADHCVHDAILLDIGLPDMDGLEVLRRLKENPHTASIPVIALTAFATEEDRNRLSSPLFADFLTKPVDTATLTSRLNGILQPASEKRW